MREKAGIYLLERPPRRVRCSGAGCGELDWPQNVSVVSTDCAGVKHRFHPKCWKAFKRWMKCKESA